MKMECRWNMKMKGGLGLGVGKGVGLIKMSYIHIWNCKSKNVLMRYYAL